MEKRKNRGKEWSGERGEVKEWRGGKKKTNRWRWEKTSSETKELWQGKKEKMEVVRCNDQRDV